VQINNSEQERQLFAVIDSDEWMGDSVNSLWGARGVALADLVQEHKEQLKRLIDNDALEIVEPPAEPAADAESGSEER
jgi:hypothetical protein